MKALKVVGIILVLFFVVLFIGGYYLFNNMGSLIKYAVETSGPSLTKTEVTLNRADMDLAAGTASLKGFKIGNPQGFDSDYLFNLGSMVLEIDTTSLRNEVIVIETLNIDQIEVQIEQKGSKINLWQLQKNLPKGGGDSQAEPGAVSGGEQKFMIEQLRFAEGRMKFISDKFGEKELSLPTLTVDNLGDRQHGLTPEELGVAILTPLLNNAKKVAERSLEAELKGKMSKKLEEKLQEELGGDLSDKLKDEQGIEKAKEKLKSLF